jgi:hypothetical protein
VPAVTVLIPTHDHGALLGPALRSVQEQTVGDLEIFVVGDGVPDVTRELVAERARDDPRIRFFDNPKGTRRGELHRHAALAEARGAIVCYQADDDLWLPGHVEELQRALAGADFASTIALQVELGGRVFPWLAALEAGVFRAVTQGGTNFLPLSAVGHTLAAYRALPHGWRTTPEGTFTDLYMWQQFLAQPGLRVASAARPTLLHFATPTRADWTPEQRLAELEDWAARLTGEEWRDHLEPALVVGCAAGVARLRRRLRLLQPLAGVARSPSRTGRLVRLGVFQLWRLEMRRARSQASLSPR